MSTPPNYDTLADNSWHQWRNKRGMVAGPTPMRWNATVRRWFSGPDGSGDEGRSIEDVEYDYTYIGPAINPNG